MFPSRDQHKMPQLYWSNYWSNCRHRVNTLFAKNLCLTVFGAVVAQFFLVDLVCWVFHPNPLCAWRFIKKGEKTITDIVLAHHSENLTLSLEWFDFPAQSKLWIYSKSNSTENLSSILPTGTHFHRLPNVGREAHAFLFHICNNYDHLAPQTYFATSSVYMNPSKREVHQRLKPFLDVPIFYLDANPDCTVIWRLIYFVWNFDRFFLADYHQDGVWKGTTGLGGMMTPASARPLKRWHKEVLQLSEPVAWIGCGWYGQFLVSRQSIYRHPKSFYERLLNALGSSRDPEEAHYMERSWRLIFYRQTDLSFTERIPFIFYEPMVVHTNPAFTTFSFLFSFLLFFSLFHPLMFLL